jgi:hypothetical protein
MSELTRREALSALGALAATRWDAEGFDDPPEEWDPIEGPMDVVDVDPARPSLTGEGPLGGFLLDRDDVADAALSVWYDRPGVYVSLEVEGEGDVYAGGSGMLDPDQARDLAVALYQAAEELERRPDGEADE